MPREYRLNDVIHETGASFSQIKDWVGWGLLPKVPLKGRYTTYPQSYVDRVKQIMDIKSNNMTSADIRDHFNPEPDS